MPTVKLVVIGASGVGKTSFRTQYVSGRFSTGYRATIGADFIAKTLPHPTKPDEVVTLQIWDTAGQERFSSLSTAFFRGADAVLLMFDVNEPETLIGLKKWWEEFRDRAPLYDEDLEDYCCVVVGNKTDLVKSEALGSTSIVSEAQAFRFLDDLVPPSSHRPSSPIEEVPITIEQVAPEEPTSPHDDSDIDLSSSFSQSRSRSININHYVRRGHSKRSSWSSANINNGTLTSTHTGVTSYHTPSSSLFDVYASARSSPLPPSVSSRLSSPIRTQRRTSSWSSTSSSAPTITPSLFTRSNGQGAATTPPTPPVFSSALDTMPHHPLPPEKGPKLFFTSAKTGEGVHEVFEYIARRVVTRWEYEEAIEASTLHVQESTGTISLGLMRGGSHKRLAESCC
ncbi:P-loop containing nucleoside triphosphate hydrolase protein [Lanmaoa asiatica]|nr:P-loop containing nucleoside triphosphate hydrolase protein [Lanmaoa asiatica]